MSQQLTDDFSDNIVDGGQSHGVGGAAGGVTAAALGNLSSSNITVGGGDQNDNDLFFDCMGRTAGGLSDNTHFWPGTQ